jgi:hypothetical protein
MVTLLAKKNTYMQQVKSGDVVNVHYHGRLTSGETFDSSEGRAPLQFVLMIAQVSGNHMCSSDSCEFCRDTNHAPELSENRGTHERWI